MEDRMEVDVDKMLQGILEQIDEVEGNIKNPASINVESRTEAELLDAAEEIDELSNELNSARQEEMMSNSSLSKEEQLLTAKKKYEEASKLAYKNNQKTVFLDPKKGGNQ